MPLHSVGSQGFLRLTSIVMQCREGDSSFLLSEWSQVRILPGSPEYDTKTLGGCPRPLAPVLRLELGLAFVGSDCRARLDGLLHRGPYLNEIRPS
jgi:hypothetical protein